MVQERFIKFAEAAKLAPGSPSAHTIWRWARRGVRSRSGEQVRLEHWRYGGKLFTTAEALIRFSEALARADVTVAAPAAITDPTPKPAPAPASNVSRRERELELAKERLRSVGILREPATKAAPDVPGQLPSGRIRDRQTSSG